MISRSVAQLKLGEVGTIAGFRDPVMALKLLEMGCLPGTEIRLDHVAPLGDPICVKILGYLLALRVKEAETIEIR